MGTRPLPTEEDWWPSWQEVLRQFWGRGLVCTGKILARLSPGPDASLASPSCREPTGARGGGGFKGQADQSIVG